VAEQLPFTDREAAFLAALSASDVKFMIVGVSAALLQGAPAVTQDIDLWFEDLEDPGLRRALDSVGGTFVPSIGLHPPRLAGSAVALFDIVLTMHGLGSFLEEWKRAIDVPLRGVTVKVLPIGRVIVSKETLNREKDRLVLPVLRDAAKVTRRNRR
jgi:hypothetical protein